MWSWLLATALQAPSLHDDLDRDSLLTAVEIQCHDLEARLGRTVRLGDHQVTTGKLLQTLHTFRDVVTQHYGTPSFVPEIRRRFDLIAVEQTYVTSYYLPWLEARRKRQPPFIYPLLRHPGPDHRYTRAQIEGGALARRGLEFAWVKDPIARYSLMVQGSGLLRFADGKVQNIGFAGSNGFRYQSMGRLFIQEGKLTEETLSWQAIKAYFAAHPEDRERYFNRNPSYCFFTPVDGGPYGLSRIPLTPGRSIATDKGVYPAGALGFIDLPTRGISRFVLDQDTGGAIRGPKRVDLYAGGGPAAEDFAGRLKHHGTLYYLLVR